jgi:hypothetical protein
VPDFPDCALPDEAEPRESEWAASELAVPERLADDPLCRDGAGFNAAASVPVDPPGVPALAGLDAGELAGGGVTESAGPVDFDAPDAVGMGDNRNRESAAMNDRPT